MGLLVQFVIPVFNIAMKLNYIIIILLCGFIEVHAQTESVFLTDDIEVQTRLHSKDIYWLKGPNSVIIAQDKLAIYNSIDTLSFLINDLRSISVQSGTLSKQGLIYGGGGGFLLGFVTGYIVGGAESSSCSLVLRKLGVGLLSGLIVGGVCAIVGALIGESSPVFEECKISGVPENSKRDLLIGFFMRHKSEQ